MSTTIEQQQTEIPAGTWQADPIHSSVGFAVKYLGVAAFTGELTIKGVTQPVTLEGVVTGPVTDPYGNERYGLSLSTVVDRTAFGLNWNNPLPGGGFALANDVTLKAELSLVKAA